MTKWCAATVAQHEPEVPGFAHIVRLVCIGVLARLFGRRVMVRGLAVLRIGRAAISTPDYTRDGMSNFIVSLNHEELLPQISQRPKRKNIKED